MGALIAEALAEMEPMLAGPETVAQQELRSLQAQRERRTEALAALAPLRTA